MRLSEVLAAGDDTAPADLNVAALPNTTILAVSGADAAAFLQGQFVNNVDALSVGEVQLNGYCTPKGRLLAVFHLIKVAEGYLILIPSSEADPFSKRLRMFVMRADVQIDALSEHHVLALWGESDHPAFQHPAVPSEINAGLHHDGTWAVRLPGALTALLAIGSETAIDTWLAPFADATARASTAWHALRLQQGEPVVRAASVDRFVPQMLNLDLIDGLSFSKGCYPGQEIVARTRYLGKQKRRTLLFSCEAGNSAGAIEPGDAIVSADGSAAGEVLDAAQDNTGWSVAVVMRLEHRDKALFLVDTTGPALTPVALPYDPLTGTDYTD